MRWSERQRAMLAEMGLRLWLPDDAAVGDAVEVALRPAEAAPPAGATEFGGSGAATARERPALLASDAALSILGRAALAERAAVCTACGLAANRGRPVFGSAEIDADWVVVGDAPDDDDDQAGAPFSGLAGVLLDNILAALGLSRAEGPREGRVYVTQAVKCRTLGRRAPETAELSQCAPFLERELALAAPRLILAMGRTAAQALLGVAEPLGKMRGRIHRREGVAVVVTYPPGHLLRHPGDKAAAWDDLCLALEALQAPPVPAP